MSESFTMEPFAADTFQKIIRVIFETQFETQLSQFLCLRWSFKNFVDLL